MLFLFRSVPNVYSANLFACRLMLVFHLSMLTIAANCSDIVIQVTLESLEGKTYAIDASILLNQALKGMKDQPNAHIHVLFLRLCKLLTYKIKPIFVFDGGVPVLKRQTIAARQRKREEATEQAQSELFFILC